MVVIAVILKIWIVYHCYQIVERYFFFMTAHGDLQMVN